MASYEESVEEVAIEVAPRRRTVDESALVLTAEGIDSRVHRVRDGFTLTVRLAEQGRAQTALAAWVDENRPAARVEGTALPGRAHPLEVVFSCTVAASLLVTHLWMVRLLSYPALRYVGSARAELILAGEYWRTITALTLHSSHAHVAGNVLIGGFFLGALTRYAGPGVGLCAVVVTGGTGNFVNALYHQVHHNSIGASTAVFAAVGILSGLEAWRRNLMKERWRGAWYPLTGALGILAMLGAPGGRTDFGAHAFGLLVGTAIGILLGLRLRGKRLSVVWQLATGSMAIALVVGAWTLALQSRP